MVLLVQVNHLPADEHIPSTTTLQYEEGPIPHKSVIKLAVLDVFANFCVTVGFAIVGSGMYQVIYSSVVIWCAILTWLFMNRRLSPMQWIAIFGTSAGLAISSMGNFSSTEDVDEQSVAKTATLMFGTLMTLGGTFFYCILYTLPRFDQMIHIKEGTELTSVWLMYLLVIVANASHSWNYYELIDRTGSVATGILQGLRAVLIYIISDAWYCESDSAQCFTKYKGVGSLLVIGCVFLFTVGRSNSAEKKLG
ncbi:hypothetical protein [Parasitella parasitica]|uniref:EamA domain-containing protein n=1 Tax=Parasitella parasitica TaxID=35722 RepID=A0A0B7N807_9FUNG|nr:hypothetical protein [Parasitella parasitica]